MKPGELKARRDQLERELVNLNQDLLHNVLHPGPRGVFYNEHMHRAIAQKELEIRQMEREIREAQDL